MRKTLVAAALGLLLALAGVAVTHTSTDTYHDGSGAVANTYHDG